MELDIMLMTVIALAHEALTNDEAWAAIVAEHPALADQRETLHSMADLLGAVQMATMLEEAVPAAPPVPAWAPQPAAWRTV